MVIDPNESKEFKLTLNYKISGTKTIARSYDRDSLPLDWAELAETLFSFISFYGFGELLSPEIYGARKRRTGDLMFLSVSFSEYSQEYCYLSNDETIQAGDRIEVPVGSENRASVAEVVKVMWLPKEEAPIPIDRIKTIIGKVGE